MPKPELEGNERAALSSVMSALSSRESAKNVADKAITAVCEHVGVEIPKREGKTPGWNENAEQENNCIREGGESGEEWNGFSTEEDDDQRQRDHEGSSSQEGAGFSAEKALKGFLGWRQCLSDVKLGAGNDEGEESSAQDYEHVGRGVKGQDMATIEAKEEEALACFADRIADAESSDEDKTAPAKRLEKYRGKETANLDDISSGESKAEERDPGSTSEPAAASDNESNVGFFEEGAMPATPPTKMAKKNEKASSYNMAREKPLLLHQPATKPSTQAPFLPLPAFFHGYISGSESEASSIEVAPKIKKNRPGQMERRRRAERKYGDKANHLQKKNNKGSRDDRNRGWDPQLGAIEDGAEEEKRSWKRGRRPFWGKGGGNGKVTGRNGGDRHRHQDGGGQGGKDKGRKKREKNGAGGHNNGRDDQGKLHPSWEAKKAARAKEGGAEFKGKKIFFY